jgi:hypothetical protein
VFAGPAGTYLSNNPSFLGEMSPHTCLPPGKYRAVLFADGALAGVSSTATAPWGALQGTGFGAIDVAFCRPRTWRGFSKNAADAQIFFSPDGTEGAAVFGFPTRALSGLSPEQAMDAVVAGVSGSDGAIPQAFPVPESLGPSYFMNFFRDAREQLWKYSARGGRTGLMWSAVGTSRNGELYVGLDFGTASNTQAVENLDLQLHNILLSYSQL